MSKFKNRKLSVLAIATFASLFFLVACADEPSGEVASDRDELIIGFSGNPAQMDPHAANDVPSRQISVHIFETLLVRDENNDLHPGLATSWEQIEDNVWQFTLREGVTFHNGLPLTAYDVEFSINRVAASPILTPIFGMFDANYIEVIDDHTINIGTTDPFAPTLMHLAHHAAAILSAETVGDTPTSETTWDELVGTGPYTVDVWNLDDRIVLERFEDFHGDTPNMRRLEFRIMTDPHARTMALEAGDVDVIINVAPTDIANLTEDPRINMQYTPSTGIEFLGMNFNHEYLGIREVRQAINYALDTETIVYVSTEGTMEPLTTYLAPAAFGFSPDIEAHPFDLDRAQELMDEVGVEGFEVELLINSGSAIRLAAAEIVQNQLQEIGITVNIQQIEWATYLDLRDDNDFDMYIGGWSNPSGDADNGLVSILFTDLGDIRMNSAEFDEMLMAGRRAIDEEERLAIYHDALVYLHEAAPFVLFGNSSHFVASGEDVRGIIVMPSNVQFYGDVYFVDGE